jgi:toxin FitB
MYLLDTHILLELRKARSGQTDPGLVSWAASVLRHNLFISALSVLEIETSLSQLETRDRPAALSLQTWLDEQVMTAFEGRILSIDTIVVRKRRQINLTDPRDALLAATASVHGLTLVTRNAQAFKSGRIKTFNPWGYTPETTPEAADWRQVAKAGPSWLKNLFLRS